MVVRIATNGMPDVVVKVDADAAMSKPLALSTSEMKEAKRLFIECDKDGNGDIDREEFKSLMESVCPGIDQAQITRAFDEIDTDGDHRLTKEEFNAAKLS